MLPTFYVYSLIIKLEFVKLYLCLSRFPSPAIPANTIRLLQHILTCCFYTTAIWVYVLEQLDLKITVNRPPIYASYLICSARFPPVLCRVPHTTWLIYSTVIYLLLKTISVRCRLTSESIICQIWYHKMNSL